MAARKIRDERDAQQCMASVEASGLSRSDWARQHGVDGRSLFAWSRKVAGSDKAQGSKNERKHSGLVELIPDASHAGSRYVIRCGQLVVEIDEHFDEATLARLLKVIAAC